MYPISALYDEYLQRRSREWLIKVDIAGTEYGSNVIVDLVVDNSLSGGQEFELGTAILSKLTLRLKTNDVIPTNARVVPYVALQLPPDMDGANIAWQDADIAWEDADFPWQGAVTEWLPLGEFFVDKREQVKDIWTFTCYDGLYLADVPYVSQLSYPTTMQAVWDEICDSLDYEYDGSVLIDPSYQIQAGPAGYSKRQVLGYIASANAACVYVAKDGTLRFRRFSASDQPVAELTTADYMRVKQTNPTKTYTKVVVVYNTEDQLAYEAGSGDDNATLYIENPFVTPAITNALLTRLNGFTYTPVEMDARGYPQIEVGDRIRYGVRAAEYDLSWQDADVAWQDADWTWDGFESGGGITIALKQTYTFKGGLRLGLAAPSKSVQESEFPVEGSLSGQINRLNKTSVREGRSYFGLTITRTDGLIVEREDHASRVIFNSDTMQWEVGGIPALRYDALSDRLKLTGDIEMLGGSITWTSVNAPSPEDVGALPDDTTAVDIGGVADDDGRLSQLSSIGDYLGSLAQGQVTGLSGKLTNLTDIGEYIGALSQGQVTGLSTRLTNITSTGVYTGTVGTDQLIAGSALIGSALIDSIAANQIDVSGGKIVAAQIDGTNLSVVNGSFSGSIAIGSGNNVFKADSNGIYLGNATFGSAPFRVNMSGTLTATNANITGTINATGGTFSGDIDVEGTLTGGTIDGAFIEGGFVVGAYITTALGTYPRIDFTAGGNLLTAYKNANDYILIDPNVGEGPSQYFYQGGAPRMLFTATSGDFSMLGLTGVLISANDDIELRADDNITIGAGGFVFFDSWSNIYSVGNGQTLQAALTSLSNRISALGG